MLLTALISTSAFAQCKKFADHPKGADFAKRQFVYRDFIKAKKYEQAMPKWRDLYTHCRAANGNILKDGEKIYKYFMAKAEKAGDKKAMAAYVDTVAIMMTQRIECYGQKTRKSTKLPYAGYRYYLLGKHYLVAATKFDAEEEKDIILEYYKKAKEALDKSLELDGNKVEDNAIEYLGFVNTELFKRSDEFERFPSIDEMREAYKKLLAAADYQIENNADEKEKAKYQDAKDKVESYYADNVVASAVFDCAYFVTRYKNEGLFQKYYNDDRGLKGILAALKRAECEEGDEYVDMVVARITAIKDSIREADKDIIDRAQDAERDGDMETAKTLYKQGIDDSSIDTHKRYKAAMRLALVYQKDGAWSSALTYFNKAASIDGNTGEPYIRIGFLYLSANKGCDIYTRQLTASIAIDYFLKAKNYSDTAAEGTNKAAEYRQYLPSREDVFARGNKIGGGTTAGCVLKASTTIRTKD